MRFQGPHRGVECCDIEVGFVVWEKRRHRVAELKRTRMERDDENRERQDIERTKKMKRSKMNPPVLENLSSKELVETYHSLHENAQPYPHAFLYPLANDTTMRTIYNEAKHNMTATFKVLVLSSFPSPLNCLPRRKLICLNYSKHVILQIFLRLIL